MKKLPSTPKLDQNEVQQYLSLLSDDKVIWTLSKILKFFILIHVSVRECEVSATSTSQKVILGG